MKHIDRRAASRTRANPEKSGLTLQKGRESGDYTKRPNDLCTVREATQIARREIEAYRTWLHERSTPWRRFKTRVRLVITNYRLRKAVATSVPATESEPESAA